jgi:quercetin dioxygenase-like cupin family protein
MEPIASEKASLRVLGIFGECVLESAGIDVARFVVPAGAGAPPHFHGREQESFLVVRGELSVNVGGEERTLRAGEAAAMPAGTPHAFVNLGPGEAEVLVLLTPGGSGGLAFYRAISALGGMEAQVARVHEVARAHGIEVLA